MIKLEKGNQTDNPENQRPDWERRPQGNTSCLKAFLYRMDGKNVQMKLLNWYKGLWENDTMCKCVQERKTLELADKIAKLLWEPVMNQCQKQRSPIRDDCSTQPSTGLVPRWQRRGKMPFFGPQVWDLQWKPQLQGILTPTLARNCQARHNLCNPHTLTLI